MNERDEAFQLVKELCQFKSPYFQEHEISEYLYRFMNETGITTIKQLVKSEEYNYECNNIIGFLDAGKKETILINAHMDTVYVTEGWDYEPYDATLVGDKVYGLGSADMKGGLTSLLLTLKESVQLYKEGKEPQYNIIFLASVDEEGPYSLGAKTFIDSEYSENIQFGLVLESSKGLTTKDTQFPTILNGSKGCYLYSVKVLGKSAHAADPSSGSNAIDVMCDVVNQLKSIKLEPHPQFSEPICNVLWIDGGQKALSTPEYCEILVDFHVTPNEDHNKLKDKIISVLNTCNYDAQIKIDYIKDENNQIMLYQPYLLDKENSFSENLSLACKEILNKKNIPIKTSICVGDFNHFSSAGIPSVIIGPDGENLHFKNENVQLPDIVKVKDILINFMFNK